MPGFTFGADMVILVGHLPLWEHQTIDEVYHRLLERLAPFGLTISRREVLYLFDAYGTLLRAACCAMPLARSYEQDRKLKVQMRKPIQQRVRQVEGSSIEQVLSPPSEEAV